MLKEGDKALYTDYNHKPYKEVVVFDATSAQVGVYVDGKYISFDAKTNRSKHTYTGYGRIYKDTPENRKLLEDKHNAKVLLDWIRHQPIEALPVESIANIKNTILNEFVVNNIDTI